MEDVREVGIRVSREAHWFIQTLRKDYGVTVTALDMGTEAVELGMDEVDPAFIPTELFEVVPSTLVYEIMIVTDTEGTVWCGAVGLYPHSPEWCVQVITKNDEVVLRNVLSLID